jgi:predicted TIM-barrel fold metal-dependent hydrolase
MILDAYWSPGSNNGDEALFAPTFRIDPLFFGYSRHAADQDGNSVYGLYGQVFDDLDAYMEFARELITRHIRGGCVAIKNAIAYDRSLDFTPVSKQQAARVFRDPSSENIKAFQDWFFSEVCALAAELNVPVQCHTGLGCLDGTRAINLRSIISRHPRTRFVIFHGGFPWTDDVLALLHFFPNVYADICWLPLLSPDAAAHTLHRMIEVAMADRISWGCDTWTAEESYGARLAVNSVLENVLENKVRSGYFPAGEAERLAQNILWRNAAELYGLRQDA